MRLCRPGQERVFQSLRPFLTSDGPSETPSPEAAVSSDGFRAALSRARRRFGEALRAEIRETVEDSRQVDDELHHLLLILTTCR